MEFFKKNQFQENDISGIVVPTEVPFLKKTSEITDIETCLDRVKQLKSCISTCNYSIKDLTNCLKDIQEHPIFCINGYDKITYQSGSSKELDSLIIENLTKHWKSQLQYFQDLKHTCEDEIDWINNKFKLLGSFNFDPKKNHC